MVGSLLFSIPLIILVLPRATAAEIAAAMWLTFAVTRYLLAIARLQSRMSFGSISLAASVRSVFGAVLGIVMGGLTNSAWPAIAGLGTGYLVGEVLGLASSAGRRALMSPLTRAAPPTPDPGVGQANLAAPRERVGYGLASSANAVANYALSVGDRFLLSTFRPLGDVGVYSATYAMVDLAGRFVPSIVLGVLRPRIFRAWDAGRTDQLPGKLAMLAASLAWLVSLSVVGIVILAGLVPALPINVSTAAWIGLGFTSLVPANTLGLLYSAATRQGRLAVHASVAAIINIGINVLLIPGLGPVGAAIATAAAYAFLLVANGSSIGIFRGLDRGSVVLMASAYAGGSALLIGSISNQVITGEVVALVMLVAGLPAAISLARKLVARDW